MERLELDDNRTKRREWKWNNMQKARAKDILQILDEMKKYQPLTERQLYYRLISSSLIEQNHWYKHGNPAKGKPDIYQALGPLLKWMRIDGWLNWDCITDEHRILTPKVGFTDDAEFVKSEMCHFLQGYTKCRAHKQPYYIEVWIEKHALLNIVKPVANKFCRRVMCCKGYGSVTFQGDFYYRVHEAIMRGQRPVVLYFGDYDPSGVDMIYRAIQTLQDELELSGVDFYRCGINPNQFEFLNANPVPVKKTDKRAKSFVEKYGETCYELDAFHPMQLQNLVRDSIIEFTDKDILEEDLANEEADQRVLADLKAEVRETVREFYS
jgi:hypothetical protein